MSVNTGATPGFSNASQPITPKIGTGYEITGDITPINTHFKMGTKFKIFKEDSDGTYVTHLTTDSGTANNIRLTKDQFKSLKSHLRILPATETLTLFGSRINKNEELHNPAHVNHGGRRRYRKNTCKKRKIAKRKSTRKH
jgi:hypothetical protein